MSNEMLDWMMEKEKANKLEYIKMEKGLHKILSLSLDYNNVKISLNNTDKQIEHLKECIDLITDIANEALIKDM